MTPKPVNHKMLRMINALLNFVFTIALAFLVTDGCFFLPHLLETPGLPKGT
jgi:hypothetical protein